MQRMLHESPDRSSVSQPTPSNDTTPWLLLIYRLPTEPASARSTVWREVRRLGALSLQHAVCLLPLNDANRSGYARLTRRIEEYGGEAVVLETTSPDITWHRKIVERFNAARDEEYDEVVDETERFEEEIARERRKGKFTFAELEDEESNLERLRKYLAQVEARDTFGAPGRQRAELQVEHCVKVLQVFADEIYAHEEGGGNSPP